MKPYRPAEGRLKDESDALTARIVALRQAGRSWQKIADDVGLSRAAVWQRYRRWEATQ